MAEIDPERSDGFPVSGRLKEKKPTLSLMPCFFTAEGLNSAYPPDYAKLPPTEAVRRLVFLLLAIMRRRASGCRWVTGTPE